MRRFAASRLLLALLALLSASTDTATKLLHGVEHAHERLHAITSQPHANGGEQATASAPDTDDDHGTLHAGVPAGVPTQLVALVPMVPVIVPQAAVVVLRAASLPTLVALARPPSADRAPTRLRAPPVG